MCIKAIIVAAGASSRMGGETPKILLEVGGKTVIRKTVEAFQATACIQGFVVVCRKSEEAAIAQELLGIEKFLGFAPGGEDRQGSVANGVKAVGACDYIAVHDAARPMVTRKEIKRVCRDALCHGAATLAVPVKDTIKVAGAEGFVSATPDRAQLRQIQTPQVFSKNAYVAALALAESQGKRYTDDCQLLEAAGVSVYLSQGEYTNIKLTTAEDLRVMAAMEEETRMRVGHGYDVHRLTLGRKLILGGVEIPYEKGLLGHSDADVLLHALADALLGAAALGDIGGMFPDTDPTYQGADSLDLLYNVVAAVRAAGWCPGNIDCTVLAQRPKLAPYIPAMREKVALACAVSLAAVNVKATTEEGLGFTGSGEGIAAHCVCTLFPWTQT